MAISNPGAGHSGAAGQLNSVAAPQKALLSSNYIDFTSGAGNDWGQQYLPDLMEKEAEVFGNRTISGFLSQVGAEEAMSSDQVVWSEQGRLHLSYTGSLVVNSGELTIAKDIDGNDITTTHGIRLNDMVILATAEGAIKCQIGVVSGATVTCYPYEDADIGDTAAFTAGATVDATILVIGSEFGKGVQGQGATTATVNNGY